MAWSLSACRGARGARPLGGGPSGRTPVPGCRPPARWRPRPGLPQAAPSTPPSRSGGWTRARARLLGPSVPHGVTRLRLRPGRTSLSSPWGVQPEPCPQPEPETETLRAGGPPLSGAGRDGALAAPWVPAPGEAPHPRAPALLRTQTFARMAEKSWQWLVGWVCAVGEPPSPRPEELSRVAEGPWACGGLPPCCGMLGSLP